MDSQGTKGSDTIVSRLAQQDKVPWHRKPNLRFLYLLIVLACFGAEVTGGFGSSIINGLQAVPSWLEYYHYPRSTSLGLMSSMHSFGSIAAIPFAPIIVDRIGRRPSILLGAVISIIGGILQGSALNFFMFIIARFLLGFSDIFCIIGASSLIAELSHPKERGVICSLFITFYDLGAALAAGVILKTFAMTNDWGWRIPSFLQVVPSLLQVSFIWFLPESPRWLISKGRGNEACAILVKYHAEGDEHSEFVQAEYTQIRETLEAELKIAQVDQKNMLSTPGMRKRVIIASFLGLFTACCGIGLTTYFLSPILDNIGIHDNQTKNVVNLASVSWSFISGTLAASIAPRYPRRRIFLACTISLFVIFTVWTIACAEHSFTHNKTFAQVALVLIFLYSSAYNLAFTSLVYTYLVELFPFHVRARGISIFQWGNRSGTLLCQLVDPIGIDLAGWRWYIPYCVWSVFQIGFVYFMFEETSGRTLEELTFLYEDERDVFGHGLAEPLREHEVTEAYGTMGNSGPTSAHGEQE